MPTQIVSDDFGRANETPLASPWSTGTSESAFNLASNAATPSSLGADCCSIHTGVSWPDDQQASVTVTVSGSTNGTGGGVCLRHAPSARTYYRIIVAAGTGGVEVARFVSGSFTSLATRTGFTWVGGDTLLAEVSGPASAAVIKVYRNGSQLGADINDNSSIGSGSAGLSYSGISSSLTLDNFLGFDLADAWPPPGSENAPETLRVARSSVRLA